MGIECVENRDLLASRLFKQISFQDYLRRIYNFGYEVSTAFGNGQGLYIFDPLTDSLKSHDLTEANIAFLVSQLIMIHGNHNDISSADGLVKSLRLLDELSALKSGVNIVEYRYSILMAINKIQKMRDVIEILQ
ncbi:hypothetical protein [Pseudomonas sp. HY7a-MNA-CIBAN-0227]|uniref:hypothetical protein n=1 Tax=Pseudomonas sp. HY7a-MNA-CIBAN-0227 TaxID=3140474 RepID=UPI0033287CD7